MASKSAALEGLPKQFVAAMKTLFEIMDDNKTGYVRLSDLETFWSEEGLSGLPKGVIESLRKVTPPNGFLSFERFCAGLKICLLRYQADQNKNETILPQRSPSAPILDTDDGSVTPPPLPPPIHPRSPTAAVRPNNAMLHHRAISMPQLGGLTLSVQQPTYEDDPQPVPPVPVHMRRPEVSKNIREKRSLAHSVYGNISNIRTSQQISQQNSSGPMLGPPKPPRALPNTTPHNVITNGALMMRTRSEITARPSLASKMQVLEAKSQSQLPVASVTERAIAKAEVRTALQQWQLAQMDSEKNGTNKKSENSNATNTAAAKRREPRRHTLQSGIDQSMLRRIQALEHERQVLLSGLQAVEKARDWYNAQLNSTQEKIRSLGKSTANDYSLDAQKERLDFKMARIEEVSRQLNMLVENSDRGFPSHMNLAIVERHLPKNSSNAKSSASASADGDGDDESVRILRRLKEQNHQLTEEVGRKSERITMLEKEKSSLIRELFQARSQTVSSAAGVVNHRSTMSEDNAFM